MNLTNNINSIKNYTEYKLFLLTHSPLPSPLFNRQERSSMQIYEKIRTIRQLKGWSQEEIAHRLDMSVSGYGSIERGETDVNLSRLEDIAGIFEVDLAELFNLNEKNFFVWDNKVGDNSQNHLQVNASNSKSECQHELEKSHLIIEQLGKENKLLQQQISDLREINDLLRKGQIRQVTGT